MVETNNKKLFNLVMDRRFETGEYNFETPYGSVKLIKEWFEWTNDSVCEIGFYLNNKLILTLKKRSSLSKSFYYEILYTQDEANKIELHNDLKRKENDLTMVMSSPNSAFIISDLNYNRFLAFNEDKSKRIEVQLNENELCSENINYNIENCTKDILVHTGSSAVAVPINPNSTASKELTKLKTKLGKISRTSNLGLLVKTILEKYEFEEGFDIESLEREEKVLKEIADFYNKYYINKGEIFKRLDSNLVFKEVEKYVEKILQEHELAIAQEKVDKIKKRIKELEN